MSNPTHEAIRSRELVRYVRTEVPDSQEGFSAREVNVIYELRGKLWRCSGITWQRDYVPIRGKQ